MSRTQAEKLLDYIDQRIADAFEQAAEQKRREQPAPAGWHGFPPLEPKQSMSDNLKESIIQILIYGE